MWFLSKRLDADFSTPMAAEAGQPKMSLIPEVFALLTGGTDPHRSSMRTWTT
ncbi:hypothetical protein [Verrucomicrobium sp. BvORR034]|uniref:hypothetical protein n=1 Tax=Verrucomicrobium sp. BvORR034 TaxID=1396418 RepID=UPI000A42C468|nr:hypothetical protein [Verrucomicrobium sp. BvORR034]